LAWRCLAICATRGATAGDPVDSDVVSFTSAIGAVQWPVAIELMISMEEKGGP